MQSQFGNPEVSGVGIFEYEQRVSLTAQKSREESGLRWSLRSLFRDVRQADMRDGVSFGRTDHAQDGARRRIVRRLRPAADLASIVPGDRSVDGGRVSIVDSVVH